VLLKIIKIKSKIVIRNLSNLFRKENLVHSIIYLIGIFFFLNILINTYYFNKSLLINSNIEKVSRTFKNQLIIFIIVFITIIIYRIYKIYIKEDKDLYALPVSDKIAIFYNLIKISAIIVFFDLLFVIFYKGFLFKLSQNTFFSINLIILFQIVIVFFFLYVIYKILLYKKKLFLLLLLFFTLILLGIVTKSIYVYYFLNFFKRYFFTIPTDYFINILLLKHNYYIYLLFYFSSFAIICFLYQRIKHNLNPLMLSSIREKLYKDLFPERKEECSKKEPITKHLQISRSLNKYFIMKDIRILLREVGSRLFITSIFILFLTIFVLDLMKEGKFILGKLAFLLILGYFVLLYSWLVALPSVGSEGLFFGFIRNSINLKRVLKSKLIFSFMVNSFLGLIISLIAMIILLKSGFLDLKFFILIVFSIAEFSFVFSYSGVITGGFFPNFKDKSKERLKKVYLTGQILYFISAPFLILLVLLLDLLSFHNLILFLAGVIIFNAIIFSVSWLLLKEVNVYLSKVEL